MPDCLIPDICACSVTDKTSFGFVAVKGTIKVFLLLSFFKVEPGIAIGNPPVPTLVVTRTQRPYSVFPMGFVLRLASRLQPVPGDSAAKVEMRIEKVGSFGDTRSQILVLCFHKMVRPYEIS